MGIPEALPTLLSPVKLRSLIKMTSVFNPHYRLIEANVGDAAMEQYRSGHIEKAIYLDTMKCTTASRMYPRNVPEKACFEEYAGNLGISNKHNVIIYDRSPFGFYASSRMWWTFKLFGHERVSILNGGLGNWIKNNYNLSNEQPEFAKENFKVFENQALIRDFAAIRKNEKSHTELVIDARGPTDFEKVDPENGKPAHIPNSKNVPYADLFDTNTGTIKETRELLEVFERQGVDLKKPLVASCLTGMTATSLMLAAHLIGLRNVSVYAGSWTEYSQKTE